MGKAIFDGLACTINMNPGTTLILVTSQGKKPTPWPCDEYFAIHSTKFLGSYPKKQLLICLLVS